MCVSQPYITAVFPSGSGSYSRYSDRHLSITELLATMMFLVISTALLVAAAASPASSRTRKGGAYALPEGAELLVGPIRTTFRCFGNGYYADVDNNCQIFHICFSQANPDGTQSNQQYSFVCGNQTVFNQLTFTCTYPDDAVPCIHAQDFFYLNTRLDVDDPEVHFLDDQDIQRAAPLLDKDLYARRVVKPQPSSHNRRFNFDDEYAAAKK